ncbi:MAG: hypothetical protein Q9163_004704 [Psora crenata]
MGIFKRRNHFPVQGRVILITGGSQGMGKALAQLLASKGANVIIVAREAAAVHPSSQRFHYISADVTSPVEATRILSEATTWNNSEAPSIIFCCAGSCHPGYFLDLPPEIFKSQMDTNYFSAAYVAHAACQAWLSQSPNPSHDPNKEPPRPETRHIIFTSSLSAFISLAGYSPYTPAKTALRVLSETLSQELLLYEHRTPIRPHCVFPGTIFSPGLENENAIKPGITKILEESDEGQTAEEVARETLSKLEKGEENITTTGMAGRAMKAAMLGGSRRSGMGIFDLVISWVAGIVLVCVRRNMDGKVRDWGKEKRMGGADASDKS